MSFRMPLAALAAVVCGAFITPASASVIGSLDLTNCAGGSVTLSATQISWGPNGTQPGTGCISTGAGTNLNYSGGTLGPAVAGDIMNVTAGGGPVDLFMSFPSITPALDFVLTSVGPGSSNLSCTGLGLGQSCSVSAGSPFILTSFGSLTMIGFTASGTVVDDGVTSLWSGLFTAPVSTSADAIQSILNDGGSVSSTYAGRFDVTFSQDVTPPVPEPSTISLLMAGGVLLGAGLMKRRA